MMLKTFVLCVKVFPGSSIEDVASELCQLADRIGVRCEASFNSVTLWAKPGDDASRLIDSYCKEIKLPPRRLKIAQA